MLPQKSMIPKSGNRFSGKIMLSKESPETNGALE
jgi:hypothetical protein